MLKFKRVGLCFLLISLIIILGFYACKCILFALFPLEHKEIILSSSDKHGVDPYVVCAIIKAESNFVSNAQSNKNAIGLMQITEPTARWIAEKNENGRFLPENLKLPNVNVEMGCWYLAYLLNRYNGDKTLAFCAYNAGLGNVDNWLKDKRYSSDGHSLDYIPFKETSKYIDRIDRYERVYRKLYPSL